MDFDLKDKTVFVAGASRGIGLGIVESLLAEGARVAMAARGAEKLEEERARLAAKYGEDRVWARAGDLRDSATLDSMVEAIETGFGPLWGAVANVGIHPCPPGFDIDDETWSAGMQQNLDSAYRLARSVLKRMQPRGEGAIVMISSIAGVDALGSPLTYGTGKAAMNHMARELARIVGPSGIRVNVIAPGNIIFPGGTWEAAINSERGEAWQKWVRREVPLQRFGQVQEIGDAAAFLLSSRASFLTGAVIPVDGGQTR
ncbi:SDR family NAD(P)-dependent oxidoreductase [Henriciella aquimarina]|uniref:SDR family NAD(P)-dependent oxidoreductase n=1 Tax=Henriciella aquimarina TaxID=545261 RepID=UPI000A018803|nr:SDR family oxidoreductase [Henriciella aquimarina]